VTSVGRRIVRRPVSARAGWPGARVSLPGFPARGQPAGVSVRRGSGIRSSQGSASCSVASAASWWRSSAALRAGGTTAAGISATAAGESSLCLRARKAQSSAGATISRTGRTLWVSSQEIAASTMPKPISPRVEVSASRTVTRPVVLGVTTKIDFPNLQGQIALHHAGPLIKWYNQFVSSDTTINATQAQKTGSIEFLDPTTGKTIFRIGLHDVGIVSLNIPGASANQDSAKRLKFELYVGWMDIQFPNAA